ncbi:MAG: hypothetical protein ACOCU4_09485 [Alkalispirochaeta sp.]
MAKKTLILTSIGVYQLVRFVVLTGLLVMMMQTSVSSGFSGVALALGGAALLPALLILQWMLTGSPVLIAPLRVALALQLTGAALTMAQVVGAMTSTMGGISIAAVLTGILVVLDAGSLLFLLLFTPLTDRHRASVPPQERTGTPQISVEEVEDE